MKRRELEKAKRDALSMLRGAGILLAKDEEIEITDFGKNDFERIGLGLVIRVSEPEYGSKWLTLQPAQVCPNHYHKHIKETFFVITGHVRMRIGDEVVDMRAGDKLTMPPGTWHTFTSDDGAIIEEVTTRQVEGDSYFEDPGIQRTVTVEDG
jgi:mannose-6-phosphate isomerase-like protein (cupin superfamily)